MLVSPTDPVTAITLLDCFDEVCPRDVQSGLWEEADARHWPASLYRLQQLKAVFRAFEIQFDPEQFANGTFICKKSDQYESLINSLSRSLIGENQRRPRSSGLPILFQWLREYRREVLRAKASYGGFFSCPPMVVEVMSKVVRPVANSITNILSPINHILSELIDPSRRVFHLDELVERHGHPTGDYAEMRFLETDFWSLAEEDMNDPET